MSYTSHVYSSDLYHNLDSFICLPIPKHHPKITFEYNYVEVSTQTHDVEHPEASYVLNTGTMGSKPLPGITPSDIRLALLVEKHFSEVFATDGRGRPTRKSKRLLGQTPTTPVEIQNLYNVDTS